MTQGSILTPTVEIELGGKIRELLLDFNAIAAAEQATGKPFLLIRNIQRANGGDYTALCWGGLLHDDPDLTLKQVRGWVNMRNVGYVAQQVLKAVKLSFSPSEDEDGDADPLAPSPAPKRKRRTGASSAASGASTSD